MSKSFSFPVMRKAGVLLAVLVLAGCGGGGGDEVPAPAIPLAEAFGNFVNAPASYQVTYSGTAVSPTGQQVPFSGSGTVSEATTASSFDSVPALRKEVTESGQFQVLGISYPVNATASSYFSTSYAPLGSLSEDGYCVVSDHHPLPTTARAGHTGAWFTSTCYSDASKTVRVGSSSASWVVEADTATSLRFKTISNLTDTTGASGVSTLTVRVSTAGMVTRLDESGTLSQDGVSLRYTGTYH